jgi:AraC-like DNA-binding protein
MTSRYVVRRSAATALHPTAQRRVNDACAFIDQHCSERITLRDVARAVNVGPFTLSHMFTSVRKMSFRTYLIRSRIQAAMQLLLDGTNSVIDVAHMAGFGDLSRFNKMFKKHVGIAPSAYRKREQETPRRGARNA